VIALSGCDLGAKTSGPPDPNQPTLDVQAVASKTSGIAPVDVEFTGVVAGGVEPLTYRWEFGDGGTDSNATAFHQYAAAGNYVATFTVTDSIGAFGSATVSMVIGTDELPVVEATSDVETGIAPLTVNFKGTVSGGDAPVTVEWQFGNGDSSNELEPEYTYEFPGNYAVTFLARDANGDTAQETLQIQVANDDVPVAAIGADPTSGPAPLNVKFKANAAGGNQPLKYAWDFGDGNTSTDADPMHTYAEDGVYTAALTVTDANGDTANSTAMIVVQTQANATPDLRLLNLDYLLVGAADFYEPNDSVATAYYLGSYGATYTLLDAFIDPFDVLFRTTVANVGPAIPGTFAVDLYRDPVAAPEAGVFGDDYALLLSLGENATKEVFFAWEAPDPGAYVAYTQVDADNVIEEYDETNNVQGGKNVTVLADEDWFVVYQTAGYAIDVTLDNLPGDYDLAIYDPDLNLVDYSNNAATTAEMLSISAPSTGYYYVYVYGYDGASSNGMPYNLTVAVE
jgi:PKD repeat protein